MKLSFRLFIQNNKYIYIQNTEIILNNNYK